MHVFLLAAVLCKHLYATGAIVLSRTQYSVGSGPVFLDNVGCQGTESSLLECYHSGIGVHNCQHDDDVGINCSCMQLVTFILSK